MDETTLSVVCRFGKHRVDVKFENDVRPGSREEVALAAFRGALRLNAWVGVKWDRKVRAEVAAHVAECARRAYERTNVPVRVRFEQEVEVVTTEWRDGYG